MARARRERGIFLPWERRGAWLRELVLARRWKVVLALAAVVGAIWGIWHAADQDSRERATREAIAEVQRAVARFRSEVGRCPRSVVELVHPPRAGVHYMSELPEDGWGRPLWVRCPSRRDPNEVDVMSGGPSGSFFADDNMQ